jgi:hypothetical protein
LEISRADDAATAHAIAINTKVWDLDVVAFDGSQRVRRLGSGGPLVAA